MLTTCSYKQVNTELFKRMEAGFGVFPPNYVQVSVKMYVWNLQRTPKFSPPLSINNAVKIALWIVRIVRT